MGDIEKGADPFGEREKEDPSVEEARPEFDTDEEIDQAHEAADAKEADIAAASEGKHPTAEDLGLPTKLPEPQEMTPVAGDVEQEQTEEPFISSLLSQRGDITSKPLLDQFAAVGYFSDQIRDRLAIIREHESRGAKDLAHATLELNSVEAHLVTWGLNVLEFFIQGYEDISLALLERVASAQEATLAGASKEDVAELQRISTEIQKERIAKLFGPGFPLADMEDEQVDVEAAIEGAERVEDDGEASE